MSRARSDPWLHIGIRDNFWLLAAIADALLHQSTLC